MANFLSVWILYIGEVTLGRVCICSRLLFACVAALYSKTFVLYLHINGTPNMFSFDLLQRTLKKYYLLDKYQSQNCYNVH